jgi:hypothetical protein
MEVNVTVTRLVLGFLVHPLFAVGRTAHARDFVLVVLHVEPVVVRQLQEDEMGRNNQLHGDFDRRLQMRRLHQFCHNRAW